MKKILPLFLLLPMLAVKAQKQDYQVAVAAFYNLENLFDTTDNPLINDEEFLPGSTKNYNTEKYNDKLSKLATVISQIGADWSPAGPVLLGVSEIENDTVLRDLANHELIRNRGYRFVHYNSPDRRGVDVALFYNPEHFTVDTSASLFVQMPGGSKDSYFTRDILWVKGKLNGETFHIYVNHWPSRSGGEARSAPAREAAATVCRKHIDSLLKDDANARIIVMGDLNDDPVNNSVSVVLNARAKEKDVKGMALYNPWHDLYRRGFGTSAYQDAWGLFDQLIVSKGLMDKNGDGYFLYKSLIFNKQFLLENRGRWKGYPMRTWDGNTYRGGYSDHFPAYLVLLRKLDKAN